MEKYNTIDVKCVEVNWGERKTAVPWSQENPFHEERKGKKRGRESMVSGSGKTKTSPDQGLGSKGY